MSKTAPTPAIHFLSAELPIEGKIHRDMFSIFYSVWANPNMKIFHIVKYLLENSPENSRTWSTRIRQLSLMYELEDPLECLRKDPPPKSVYKENVLIKITSFFEKQLRLKADSNWKMQYFNVSACNLRGRYHPAICSVSSENEVKQMRPHLKMLTGDYLTYQVKSHESGGPSHCRICSSENTKNIHTDSVKHILTSCSYLQSIQENILSEIRVICDSIPYLNFSEIENNCEDLTQFLLDPSSLNLKQRVSPSDEILSLLFSKVRNLCWALDKARMAKLKSLLKRG